MTSQRLRPVAHRVAELPLRGRSTSLATRVYWPAGIVDMGVGSAARRSPALVVLVPEGAGESDAARADALSHGLCASAGVVVLTLLRRPGPDVEIDALRDASSAVEWSADHAGELGADGGRLVVAGRATGAALAAAVARQAAERGWPEIVRQVLIGPDTDRPDGGPPPCGPGLAPATVVTIEPAGGGAGAARADLATRLRRAGVRIDELRYLGLPPGEPAWAPWSGAADLVVTDLARSLQHRLGLPPTAATRSLTDHHGELCKP
jgi:hypothetical protein